MSSAPPASEMCEPGPAQHRAKLIDPARLAALAASELMDSATEVAFDRFTHLAAKWLRVPVALVSLVDDKRQFFKSAVGLGEPWATRRETPLTHSFCQYGVTAAEPLLVMDAREHPWLRKNLAIAELGVIAYAGVPLVTSEEQVIGMLCAIDSAPREWSADDVGMLSELGALVATELELRARVRALKISEAASEENRTLLHSVLDCMEDAVVVIAPDGQILLTNDAAKRDRPTEVLESTRTFTSYGLFLPDGVTPLPLADAPGMRALNGETVRDVEILSRLPGMSERSFRVNSAPIRYPSGVIRGAVTVGRDNTQARLARSALARSVDLFRTVVRNLPNGAVILFDQNLRYMMADGDALFASIGLSSQALVGKSLQEVASPERFEAVAEHYRAALRGETRLFEVTPTPGERTFAVNVVPVRDERGTVTAGMALIYDVTSHKRTEAALRQQADEIRTLSIRDELTGLYNRRGFLELARHQLKLADRSGRPALLFFVDLNGMKRINDEFGHDEGDRALCETADVLRAAFRACDVVARLGGDEFVALLPDATEPQIELFAARIGRELADRSGRASRSYRLSASIGGSAYDPSEPQTIEALLAKADTLMYEQKHNRSGSRRSPVPASPPPNGENPDRE